MLRTTTVPYFQLIPIRGFRFIGATSRPYEAKKPDVWPVSKFNTGILRFAKSCR